MKKTVHNTITQYTTLLLISSCATIYSMKPTNINVKPNINISLPRLQLLLIKPGSLQASSGLYTNTITVHDKNNNPDLHVEYTAKRYLPCSGTYEYFRCGTFINYIGVLGPKKELDGSSIVTIYDPTAVGIKEFIIKANDYDTITVRKKKNKRALITMSNTMQEQPQQVVAEFCYRS